MVVHEYANRPAAAKEGAFRWIEKRVSFFLFRLLTFGVFLVPFSLMRAKTSAVISPDLRRRRRKKEWHSAAGREANYRQLSKTVV